MNFVLNSLSHAESPKIASAILLRVDFVDIFNTAFEEKLNKWMHDSRLQLDTRFAAEQLYNRLQEEINKRQEMAVQ